MSVDHEIPGWGKTARRAFRNVFSPLIGVCMLLNLLTAMGWDIRDVASAPVRTYVLFPLTIAAVAGFVIAGVVWLVAEVRAGFDEPRDQARP